MIKKIKSLHERNKLAVSEISNRQLAKRWGCSNANIGRWDEANCIKARVLRAGAAVNFGKSLPVPHVLELEAYCAERGMVVSDLPRISGYGKTSIRRFVANPKHHIRFWDLLEGCVVNYYD